MGYAELSAGATALQTGGFVMNLKEKFAKAIRVLSTAPVFACILCTLLYFLLDGAFASLGHYLAALFFLTVLPVLAYPVSVLIPPLRRKGRDGQRNLAIVFSVLGYIGGFLFTLLAGGTGTEKVLFGTYLISGSVLAVCTCLHYKASGHACGCSGPVAMLSVFICPWFLFGYLLITPIFWSSVKLKRHTVSQLLVGSVIPVLAMLVCCAQFL